MALQNLDRDYWRVAEHIFSTYYDVSGAAYDSKARGYEKLVSSVAYNKMVWGTHPKDYTDFAEKAILSSTGTCIDIGCGGLAQTAGVYSLSTQPVVLLDHSIEMLKIASERLLTRTGKWPETIDLLQANAFDLPFPNESVDNVFSFGLIHCFENKRELIREALRVLKVNGRFYFTSMTSDRRISNYYMGVLRLAKAFGKPFTSRQMMELFDSPNLEVEYSMKGSMIFISGRKIA